MSKREDRKAIKENRKKAKGKITEQKEQLLEEWKEEWKKPSGGKDLNTFFELFVPVYEFVFWAKEDNKSENFRWKKCFLYLLIFCWVVYVSLFVYHLFWKDDTKFLSLAGISFSIVLLIFLSSIISKWLDIKKYQETWARHSGHLNMMELEMMRFISNIAPYNGQDKKLKFAENILKIWGLNQDKFVHNMEEKEKGMLDIFEIIKGWNK